MAKKKENPDFKKVARNKKAYFDYHILDKYEAGLVLTGSEIKSIRSGAITIKDGYIRIKNGEAYLENVNIAKYTQGGSHFNHEPERTRKLLLHRREINQIEGKVSRKGLTVLPLSVYIKRNRAKVEIGLARSKKKYDKKQDIIRREAQRADNNEIKQRSRRLTLSGE